MITQTIAAIATPPGRGGIGIIKISGKDAISVAASIFRKSGKRSEGGIQPLESHRIYHGHIVEPDSGRVLDEVLLTVMKAPRSYTREDVIEINAHSGFVVLTEILELLLSHGVRLAGPGEFTKRAFLNGRIDLSQAEGIADIINARTKKALEMAAAQARGLLGHSVQVIRNRLVGMVAEVEAGIDFPDDAVSSGKNPEMLSALQAEVIEPISCLIEKYRSAKIHREGVKVAVVGRPNVGKSSLVNRLLRKDRVIVTPIPGTTRDLVEEALEIGGIHVTVTDTAGLHASKDPVERMGIQKTKECVSDSDMIFFMVEANREATEEDLQIRRLIGDKPAILVANKSDLAPAGKNFSAPMDWHLPSIVVSVLYDRGIDRLKTLFIDFFQSNGPESDEGWDAPNLRQKLALEKSMKAAGAAIHALLEGLPEDLVVIDLREALDALGEITGDSVDGSILDEIFRRFCIGK